MSENPENTNQTKSETMKIDGVSAQINLSPGSETHKRFANLLKQSGAESARAFVAMLMENYENPHIDTDNSEVIERLEKEISDLKSENGNFQLTRQNYEEEIDQLKLDLAAARNEANENATKATRIETTPNAAKIAIGMV